MLRVEANIEGMNGLEAEIKTFPKRSKPVREEIGDVIHRVQVTVLVDLLKTCSMSRDEINWLLHRDPLLQLPLHDQLKGKRTPGQLLLPVLSKRLARSTRAKIIDLLDIRHGVAQIFADLVPKISTTWPKNGQAPEKWTGARSETSLRKTPIGMLPFS
ncbi:MAG: hypothetical protein NTZ90_06060 [Proteobacteria bacterium]|nr:hypothetical protein [Pseudomonadota bacterium]